MSSDMHRYVSVEFENFKAFKKFKLDLKHINILVGPNNSGKSTIIAAFRILAAGLRKANTRNPELVEGPSGAVIGYGVDLAKISIAEENIYYNYDDDEIARISFKINNGNVLVLYFPAKGVCNLIPSASGDIIRNTLNFKKHFKCKIGFVPILGPVEHYENLYEKDTAYNALYNYRAARNFRNIWHHFPEEFDLFRDALQKTWPGMDIKLPEVSVVDKNKRLYMYCLEKRITREIFWSGFGFQVWCQMLTHVMQNKDVSIFLIDEPDIYLHAELQRQLVNILKQLGPDILIATHSTEMLIEADTNEIVLINKENEKGHRVRDLSRVDEIFSVLGSALNPVLTQLAKTRRVLFVEGKDFKVLSQFGRKLKINSIANRRGFAVIELEGFNPDKIKTLKLGMEKILGAKISSAVVLDRDYRSDDECAEITKMCREFCEFVQIHECKEIENYLLVPSAINRAARKRLSDRLSMGGSKLTYEDDAEQILQDFCSVNKGFIAGQLADFKQKFVRKGQSGVSISTISSEAYDKLDKIWANQDQRLKVVPGKLAISALNIGLEKKYSISITHSMIIDAMHLEEIPLQMTHLVRNLEKFVEA